MTPAVAVPVSDGDPAMALDGHANPLLQSVCHGLLTFIAQSEQERKENDARIFRMIEDAFNKLDIDSVSCVMEPELTIRAPHSRRDSETDTIEAVQTLQKKLSMVSRSIPVETVAKPAPPPTEARPVAAVPATAVRREVPASSRCLGDGDAVRKPLPVKSSLAANFAAKQDLSSRKESVRVADAVAVEKTPPSNVARVANGGGISVKDRIKQFGNAGNVGTFPGKSTGARVNSPSRGGGQGYALSGAKTAAVVQPPQRKETGTVVASIMGDKAPFGSLIHAAGHAIGGLKKLAGESKPVGAVLKVIEPRKQEPAPRIERAASPLKRCNDDLYALRMRELSPSRFEDNYELSEPGGDSDQEGYEEIREKARLKKPIPDWCTDWIKVAKSQEHVDPDTIFGSVVPDCNLDRVFSDSLYRAVSKDRPARTRGSSGNWSRDRLKSKESDVYKQRMGQTKAWNAPVARAG